MAQENQQTTAGQAPPQPSQNQNGADGGGTAAPPRNGNGASNGAPQNGAPQNAAPQNGAPQGQAPVQPAAPEEAKPAGPSFTKSPVFKLILVVVIVIACIWGVNFWKYSQNHVSTDDAYVTGDLINVSPIISGTLSKLTVDEGDVVKAGQVIAILDQSGPRAAYQQAVAAYQAAQSEIPQAQTNLAFEQLNVNANINQARAALAAQQAKTAQSQRQVQLIASTTQTQVVQDQASAAASLAQAETAQAQANSALQAVQTAKNAALASHQQIVVNQANYTRAQRDANRYQALYGPNGSVAAVTAQQVDQAIATADSTRAELQQAQDQASQADSQVVQTVAQYKAAVATANAAMRQYKAALAQVQIAQANQIQVPVQKAGVSNNAALADQNAAQLQGAIATQSNVKLRRQQVLTAQAQSLQAKAAARNALVTLDDTVIAAPSDGTVVRKGVNVGDALTPGQTIVTMTRGDYVWVQANFKETQLAYVRVGQPVEVSVDAYPGKVYHGYVQSVNEASGNTTSLLPADNATGNFTKVVQRIPVKILLHVPKDTKKGDADAADIRNLRQGMSVEADIDVTEGRKHPDQNDDSQYYKNGSDTPTDNS